MSKPCRSLTTSVLVLLLALGAKKVPNFLEFLICSGGDFSVAMSSCVNRICT